MLLVAALVECDSLVSMVNLHQVCVVYNPEGFANIGVGYVICRSFPEDGVVVALRLGLHLVLHDQAMASPMSRGLW